MLGGHACPPMQTGVGYDRDINLRTLNAAGVKLTGPFIARDGFKVRLADDLESNGSRSDEAAEF